MPGTVFSAGALLGAAEGLPTFVGGLAALLGGGGGAAEAKAAEQAEEAAAIAEILEREAAEELLALKVEAALASGLKVSSKEDVSA